MCSGDRWFRGVVVITSALHAEGREFDPRRNLFFFIEDIDLFISHKNVCVASIFYFLAGLPNPNSWQKLICNVIRCNSCSVPRVWTSYLHGSLDLIWTSAHSSRLAQSVEHETLNLGVVGSSPTLGVFFFFNSWLPVGLPYNAGAKHFHFLNL